MYMKTIRIILVAAAFLAAASCEKPSDVSENAHDAQLKAAVEQYVPGVIYKIYGNLADASEQLYTKIAAMKEAGTYTQAQIDGVCTTFLEARKWWEQSEAFLYGAAKTYGIDPHIDSWPLDKDKLAKSLSNAETIAAKERTVRPQRSTPKRTMRPFPAATSRARVKSSSPRR